MAKLVAFIIIISDMTDPDKWPNGVVADTKYMLGGNGDDDEKQE